MKTDVIILGAELDALVAAARLHEHGCSVRIIAAGAGSLNYSPDGIHVLGFSSKASEALLTSPLDEIPLLAATHPYQKIGGKRVRAAFDWYLNFVRGTDQEVTINEQNEMAVSPVGLPVPVYAITRYQATMRRLAGKSTTIISFRGHRDFPVETIACELRKHGITVCVRQIDAPDEVVENSTLAKTFEMLEKVEAYFEPVNDVIPDGTEVVLFPAVMGMSNHCELLHRMGCVLGLPCMEVSTLPPSVPGMRLEQNFQQHLLNNGVAIDVGTSIRHASLAKPDRIVLEASSGRRYEAGSVIVASGGVLMGGLEVDSHGVIHETSLDLSTYQSAPLHAKSVLDSLTALHTAGVETDDGLRPRRDDVGLLQNVFVTGRTLAHWDPAAEISAEGVCIATGWVAAENAQSQREKRTNG